MQLIYQPEDRPKTGHLFLFALQQLLAVMAATIAVPAVVGNGLTASAALFGAGVGTLVYQLFTHGKSPVFLGSSFAFIGSMLAAFAGGVSMSLGALGLVIGSCFAGLVYVVIALVVRFAGVAWIGRLMPAVVIGPTVALIGLSLASAAVNDVFSYAPKNSDGAFLMNGNIWLSFLCAIVTLVTVVLCSVYGKKAGKLFPFILGIGVGYLTALVFTVIGLVTKNDALLLIDLAPFQALTEGGISLATFLAVPEFVFLDALRGCKEFEISYLATIAVAYVPVAFVVFAEHIADHKNLSSIIERDLLEEPGLHATLLGDGIGSIAGAFFGGCPNTTYGESVGCVAITGNASISTITLTAVMAIVLSFLSPIVAFLDSIPGCVMGGVCITLYGFIAVSGLKMIQKVDLEDNANLFTVSVILISGIGGMAFAIGKVTITAIASALILGIFTNLILQKKKKD